MHYQLFLSTMHIQIGLTSQEELKIKRLKLYHFSLLLTKNCYYLTLTFEFLIKQYKVEFTTQTRTG